MTCCVLRWAAVVASPVGRNSEDNMKQATRLRAVWALTYAFVLVQLLGCGSVSGAGQETTPVPTSTPISIPAPPVPAAEATGEPSLPEPVISVVRPANSATAILQATAVAQRTATALADSTK